MRGSRPHLQRSNPPIPPGLVRLGRPRRMPIPTQRSPASRAIPSPRLRASPPTPRHRTMAAAPPTHGPSPRVYQLSVDSFKITAFHFLALALLLCVVLHDIAIAFLVSGNAPIWRTSSRGGAATELLPLHFRKMRYHRPALRAGSRVAYACLGR